MVEGYIHSVESLGTSDGPGIRYVIFIQGCPLRCKYCHNPDTWKKSCGTKVSVEELIDKIKRCRPYIDRSGGGVTISGGEPTLQLDFVLELLKRCKDEGLQTAIDTSGYIDQEKFEKLLPYLDLVLLDIKQIDDEKHQELTGVSNQKTLELVKLMEEEKRPYWVRHVVVSGYTDDEEDITGLAEFLTPLKMMEKLELLPYHKLGEHKWKELGLEYELAGVDSPIEEEMEKIKEIFTKYNIKC